MKKLMRWAWQFVQACMRKTQPMRWWVAELGRRFGMPVNTASREVAPRDIRLSTRHVAGQSMLILESRRAPSSLVAQSLGVAAPLSLAELHRAANPLPSVATLDRLERGHGQDTLSLREPLPEALAMATPPQAATPTVAGNDGAALAPWSARNADEAFASLYANAMSDPLLGSLFANPLGEGTGRGPRFAPHSELPQQGPDGGGGGGGSGGGQTPTQDGFAGVRFNGLVDQNLFQSVNAGLGVNDFPVPQAPVPPVQLGQGSGVTSLDAALRGQQGDGQPYIFERATTDDGRLAYVTQGNGFVLGLMADGAHHIVGNTDVHISFVGASMSDPIGFGPRPGATRATHVLYQDVYAGIDLLYYTNRAGELEYDLYVDAGVSTDAIRLNVDGASGLALDANGNLIIHAAGGGGIVQYAPHVYQHIEGVRYDVASSFVLTGTNQLGFSISAYDTRYALVIDPITTSFREYAVPTAGGAPIDIVNVRDGTLAFAEFGAGKVGSISIATGAITETSVSTGTPPDLTVATSNDVWYSGWNTALVGRVGGSTYTDTVTSARPNGIAFDPSTGYVGWVNFEGGYFQEINPADNNSLVRQVQLNATSNTLPTDLVYHGGYAWTSAFGTNQVLRISSTGTVNAITTGTQPVGLAVDSTNGLIYVANYGGDSLTIINASTLGTTTVSLGTGSVPYNVVKGPDGNAWVALSGTNKLARVTLGGTLLGSYSIAGSPTGIAASTAAVNSGSAGALWVTDQARNQIGKQTILEGEGQPITAVEGQSGTWTIATFGFIDPAATAGSFTASINWGDGTSAGTVVDNGDGTFSVVGTRTYTQETAVGSPYTVTVTITEQYGAVATVATTATVVEGPLVEVDGPRFFGPYSYSVGSGANAVTTIERADLTKVFLVANYFSNSISVYQSDGNGGLHLLQTITGTTTAAALAVGNFNNNPDSHGFAVANYTDNSVKVYVDDGIGAYKLYATLTPGTTAASVIAGDFNNDGKDDIAVANQGSGNVSVFINNGSGFNSAVNYSAGSGPVSIVKGDFFGNGRVDLAVANANAGTVSFLANSGTGTFASPVNVATGAASSFYYFMTTGDFDGNGKLDVALADFDADKVRVFYNNNATPGTLAVTRVDTTVPDGPDSLSAGDVNNDGKLDLLVGSYWANSGTVLYNNGDTTFSTETLSPGSGGPNGVALADFNRDNLLDAAIAMQDNGTAQLFLSELRAVRGDSFDNYIVARFSDTSGTDTTLASNYTATIDWGDGSPLDTGTIEDLGGGVLGVKAPEHMYADVGKLFSTSEGPRRFYPVTVNIRHGSVPPLTIVTPISVADSVLIATGATVTVTAGAPDGGNIATFNDDAGNTEPGSRYRADVYWGDLTPTERLTPELDGGVYVIRNFHPYATPGTYTATIIITDETGGAVTRVLSTVNVIAATATALTASPSPSQFGQSVTFTATVTSAFGTPTGSVTFNDGVNSPSTVGLTSGVATYSPSTPLPQGFHTVTATYNPTGSFVTSGNILTQQVKAAADWTITDSGPNVNDPYQGAVLGQVGLNNGAVNLRFGVDGTRSSGFCLSCWLNSVVGMLTPTALVYRSNTIDVKPVIRGTITSKLSDPVPSTIQARVTWDGTTYSWFSVSTAGGSVGGSYSFAFQVPDAVTTSKNVAWTLEIKITLPDTTEINRSTSGVQAVEVATNSAFGAGWSLAGWNSLIISGAGIGFVDAATGNTRFFTSSGGGYTSPANDQGTLAISGSNYTYTDKFGVVSTFDSNGKMLSTMTPQGVGRTYTYSSGDLVSLTEADGGTLGFGYSSGKVNTFTMPGSRSMSASFTSSDLTSLTNAAGDVTALSYDANHRIENMQVGQTSTSYVFAAYGGVEQINNGLGTITTIQSSAQRLLAGPIYNTADVGATVQDANANVTSYGLDVRGRMTGITTPDGAKQILSLNAAGNATLHVDALQRRTSYTYNGSEDLTRITAADGSITTMTYDGTFHKVTSVTDALNHTTTYVYDGTSSDLLNVIDALGNRTTFTWTDGLKQTQTDALGRVTTYQWDSGTRRLLDVIDPLGNRTTYGYDSAGNNTTVEDPLGRVTTSTYDGERRLLTQTNALGGVQTYTYTATGQMRSMTDELGRITSYVYDARDFQTTVIEALGTGQERRTTSAYDAAGNVRSMTNPLGQITSYVYDSLNRPTATIEAFGTGDERRTTTTFDIAGRVRSTTDPLGRVTSFAYDSLDRQTAVISGYGTAQQRTTSTVYDADGNVIASIDALGRRTTFTYDAIHRNTEVQDALGNRSTTVYDAINMTASVDALGRRTTYSYDARDRMTQMQDALGNFSTMVYNAINMTASVDALGRRTSFVYDNLNRQIEVQDAFGNRSTAVYDAASNMTASVDALGRRTTYSYDALNRQFQMEDALGQLMTTVYDAGDNVTASVDALGRRTSFVYDNLNRLIQTQDALNNLTTAVYDDNSNLTASIDALGRRTTYAYDALDRMTKVTDALGNVMTTVYDRADNVVATDDALGRRTLYNYDALNRNTSTKDALGGLWTSVYDAVGNTTVSIDALGRRTTYVYDALNRQTEMQDALGNRTTAVYDAVSNQTVSIDALARRTTFTYDVLNRQTQTQDALGNFTTAIYDAVSNYIATVDQLGRRTTFAYDALNRQTTMTDALGQVTTTAYNAVGDTIAVTNARGFTTSYAYDNLDRVISTTDALNNVSTAVYDAVGNTTVSIDALGRRTTYAYDALNRVTQVQDALANRSTVVYDAVGNTTANIDALGRRTTYVYDALNRQTAMQDALGNRSTVIYDAVGNTLTSIDALGQATFFAYDALDRQTTTTDALNNVSTMTYDAVGNATRSIDALGRITTFTYDVLNRQTEMQDALGNRTTAVYDAVSNMTVSIDALGRRTSYVYDVLNRQTQVQDALGNFATTVYDQVGNTTVSIDQFGQRTTFVYDAIDRQTTMTTPLGFVTTSVYDAVGNTTAMTNPRGFTTSFTYDALDRRTQTEDALNGLWTSVYDAVGNTTVDIDALGRRTTYVYDALDRQIATTDALAHTTSVTYNAVGNVATSIDALGFVTTFAYDALNRRVSVKTPSTGVSTTAYDAVGNVTATTNPIGDVTQFTYDVLNRQTVVRDPRGSTTTYVFDAVGNRINLIDPDGNKSTFTFDALDRQVTETDPLAKTITYTFDALGRQTSKTDRTGRLITYGYDADSRQTGETWKNSIGTVTNTFTMSYDQNANQLTASKDGATITMTFDALDRVATRQDPNTLATFTYDAVGNRTKVQDSFGATTTSVYNAVNLLTSRQLNDGTNTLREDFTYTNRDQMALASRYSDLAASTLVGTSSYVYDSQGRLTHLQFFDGSSTSLAEYTYTYDIVDRIKRELLNGTPTTYTYDSASQLVNDDTTQYVYDANGNRIMSGYVIGAGNRLLASPGATYTYDNEGNVTGKTDSSGTWAYSYDNQNQLAGATQTSATALLLTQATYVYDALGNMASKSVYTQSSGLTTVTKFAADVSGQTWADLTSGGSLTTRYVLGEALDSKYARVDAGGVSWLLTDRLGSVRDVTNGSGVLTATTTYDGFGNVTASSGTRGAYGFVGQRDMDEPGTTKSDGSGRIYDTVTGRWRQQDIIRFGGGDTNLWRYVGNNPTNKRDPSGLAEEPIKLPFEEVDYAEDGKGGVYELVDKKGKVVRTGRTNDLARREKEHARDPNLKKYEFKARFRTDDKATQRGLAQRLHELRTKQGQAKLDKIRDIDPNNPKLKGYKKAADKYLKERREKAAQAARAPCKPDGGASGLIQSGARPGSRPGGLGQVLGELSKPQTGARQRGGAPSRGAGAAGDVLALLLGLLTDELEFQNDARGSTSYREAMRLLSEGHLAEADRLIVGGPDESRLGGFVGELIDKGEWRRGVEFADEWGKTLIAARSLADEVGEKEVAEAIAGPMNTVRHKVERAHMGIAEGAAYAEWLQSLSNDELIEHAESMGIEVEDDDDLDEVEHYLSEIYTYSSLLSP